MNSVSYRQPSSVRSTWQIASTLILFFFGWYVTYHCLTYGYWYLLPTIVVGGIMARLFVLFHDLTHGSLFASRRANQIVGWFLGVLCWTPTKTGDITIWFITPRRAISTDVCRAK